MTRAQEKVFKHINMAKSTNKLFRYILDQEGQANNIKVIKHARKANKHARKAIKYARKIKESNNEL